MTMQQREKKTRKFRKAREKRRVRFKNGRVSSVVETRLGRASMGLAGSLTNKESKKDK